MRNKIIRFIEAYGLYLFALWMFFILGMTKYLEQ